VRCTVTAECMKGYLTLPNLNSVPFRATKIQLLRSAVFGFKSFLLCVNVHTHWQCRFK